MQNILRERQSTEKGRAFLETQTLQEMRYYMLYSCTVIKNFYSSSALWDLKEYFNEEIKSRESRVATTIRVRSRCAPLSIDSVEVLEKTDENGIKIIQMPLHFIRGNFANADLPKMILHVRFS